jgi:hypothetical protein
MAPRGWAREALDCSNPASGTSERCWRWTNESTFTAPFTRALMGTIRVDSLYRMGTRCWRRQRSYHALARCSQSPCGNVASARSGSSGPDLVLRTYLALIGGARTRDSARIDRIPLKMSRTMRLLSSLDSPTPEDAGRCVGPRPVSASRQGNRAPGHGNESRP